MQRVRKGAAPLDKELAQQALDAYTQHPTKVAAALALGLPRNTFTERLEIARRMKLAPSNMPAKSGPFSSGKSYEEKPGRLELTGAGKALVVSDIHLPFHSEAATDIAINDGIKQGVSRVIIAGDGMDFHSMSNFNRDPKHRDLGFEVERGREFLASLRGAFPRAQIVYMEGNHETRLASYLMKMAPELFGLSELSIPNLLNMGGNGITYADAITRVFLGKLCIVHGHEYRIGAGVVNVARVLLQRAGINIMCGHHHKSKEDIKTLADGSVIGAWSIGCLSGLSPRWLPMNEWNHGYAVIETEDDGGFEVSNRTIIRGKVR